MRLLLTLLLLLPSAALAQLVDVGSCPAGQSLNPNTSGHCCWPGQVWAAEGRCAGIPQCPAGSIAKGEACVPTAPPDVPKVEATAKADEAEKAPLVPINFRITGGVLFGSWFGGSLGVQVQIPLWQPWRGKHVGGYLFTQIEGELMYFSQQQALGGYLYTFGGLVGLTMGWSQRLSIISIVPRIGPAVVVASQWGDHVESDAGVYIIGLAGIDLNLHLGRVSFTIGGDYMFNANKGIWLTRIGIGF